MLLLVGFNVKFLCLVALEYCLQVTVSFEVVLVVNGWVDDGALYGGFVVASVSS